MHKTEQIKNKSSFHSCFPVIEFHSPETAGQPLLPVDCVSIQTYSIPSHLEVNKGNCRRVDILGSHLF